MSDPRGGGPRPAAQQGRQISPEPPEAPTPPPDLRLLVPALVAWSTVALGLGHGPLVPGIAAVVLVCLASVEGYRVGVAGASRRAPGARSVERRGTATDRRFPAAGPPGAGAGRSTGDAPATEVGVRRGRSSRTGTGRGSGRLLVLLLSGALLVLTAGGEARAERGPVSELARDKATVIVTGRISGEPRRLRSTDPGPARVAVTMTARVIEGRGTRTIVHTPILVLGGEEWLTTGWRQEVTVRGRLSVPDRGERVKGVLAARSGPEIRSGPGVVVSIADRTRAAVREAVEPLPEDPRGLVPAIVIGDRAGIPDDLEEAMRSAGMSHLTAVSGTNCSLVVAAALWVCGLAGLPRRGRPVVGILVLGGFVVLARPDPSVIRAAVMGAIGLIGVLRSRRPVGLPMLAAAILVLLAVDPWLARSYGFALSVLATLGLLVFARPWAVALRRRLPIGPLAEALTIPLAAQVMCAPVVVLLQGEVSLVGVVANALVGPLVAPATVSGALVAVTAVPWPWAATVIAWTAALPTWGMALVARGAQDVPLRAIPWRDDAVGAALLAMLLLAVVLGGATAYGYGRRHVRVVAVLALSVLVVVVPVLHVRTRDGFPGPAPALVMCDVGQGDAFVALTAPQRAVVVDTGPDPDLLDRCLDDLDVTTVDAVVLTHFDRDHVGGLDGIDRGRAVGDLVVSDAAMTEVPAPVARWWTAHGRAVHPAAQGDAFTWGDVSVLVRGPRRGRASRSPNSGSLVTDVVVDAPSGPVRALLLADVDEEGGQVARRHLLLHPRGPGGDAAQRPVDVVKVAHHGSADHDPDLLMAARAPVALISVGAENRYGHPTPRLLDSVVKAGSLVYRTDRDGAVAIRNEAGTITIVRQRR